MALTSFVSNGWAFVCSLFKIHADGVFINQLGTEKTGGRNQHHGDAGQIDSPGRYRSIRGRTYPQQPVQSCQGQQHDRQRRVTPGRDQAPLDAAGQPATAGSLCPRR